MDLHNYYFNFEIIFCLFIIVRCLPVKGGETVDIVAEGAAKVEGSVEQ